MVTRSFAARLLTAGLVAGLFSCATATPGPPWNRQRQKVCVTPGANEEDHAAIGIDADEATSKKGVRPYNAFAYQGQKVEWYMTSGEKLRIEFVGYSEPDSDDITTNPAVQQLNTDFKCTRKRKCWVRIPTSAPVGCYHYRVRITDAAGNEKILNQPVVDVIAVPEP